MKTVDQPGYPKTIHGIKSYWADVWNGKKRTDLTKSEDDFFNHILNDGYVGIKDGVIFKKEKKP